MISTAMTFAEFEAVEVQGEEANIFFRRFGSGPSLLLLHELPQTHLMWRSVAPLLARSFTVICPDLRGYGRSGCPPSSPDHAPYSKRAMANDMVSVLEAAATVMIEPLWLWPTRMTGPSCWTTTRLVAATSSVL